MSAREKFDKLIGDRNYHMYDTMNQEVMVDNTNKGRKIRHRKKVLKKFKKLFERWKKKEYAVHNRDRNRKMK